MISKEELNQLQKLTPSIMAVHSLTARKTSSYKATENSLNVNVGVFGNTDGEGVWTKMVMIW
jgi:hypothetical protein